MVAVTGELDLALLQSMAKEVAHIIQQTGVCRVLNDLRIAQPSQSTFDIYSMPKTARKIGVSQFCRRALVVGNRSTDFRFLETVFINQGHQVRMFAEIEDAKEWLFGE